MVAALHVFPFKSLPGVSVRSAAITGGGLLHDREFAMFDEFGYVNGKRDAGVYELHVEYAGDFSSAVFTSARTHERFGFAFGEDTGALETSLSRHFGRRIAVRRSANGGFPDDLAAPGPTVIASATLGTVATWFSGLDAQNVRMRLRTNIEIGGVPPFWEDRLYGAAGTAVAFGVGSLALEGTNPCQRCSVPARDPRTAQPLPGFAKRVAERRAASLPAWADATRFDHYYRLAVNTRPAFQQTGTVIRVGDVLTLDDVAAASHGALPASRFARS